MSQDLLSMVEPAPQEKEPLAVHIEGYEVQELIGGGGMGEVYRAVALNDGSVVALKLVAGRWTRDPEVVARFEREVAALLQLDHPNVVRLLDHGETADARHYLVMEYVDGCDLRRLLRAQRVEMERAFDIFGKVCAGVAHAHERGLAHRDIKPANILIGVDGTVKVADFGLAKTLVDTVAGYGFTQTRDTFGTPYYVAPEVTRDASAADARSDVYALGVLLYELLTGAVPMGQFTPLSVKSGLDRSIDALVNNALADDPARRLASVSGLASSVEAIAEDHRRGHVKQKRLKQWMAMAAAVFVLAIGAAFGAWYASQRDAAPKYAPPEAATKQSPWTNSLGMKFVPVPKTKLLFSVWETRIRDFEAFFAADTAVLPDWRTGPNDRRFTPSKKGGKEQSLNWRNPGTEFQQTPDHPVCGIFITNARMFCAWLTWKERLEGRIASHQRYRLPTSEEWSHAAGLRSRDPVSDAFEEAMRAGDPQGLANLGGVELRDLNSNRSLPELKRRDPFARTAPVGSFPPNVFGLYDMAGNLAELTDTEAPSKPEAPGAHYYYLRGGAWITNIPEYTRLEHRKEIRFNQAYPSTGFRIVLDLEPVPSAPQQIQNMQADEGTRD